MIEYIPIEKLLLYDRNPRKITDKQFKKLMKSIDQDYEFLEARPILVNYDTKAKTYTIYAGNQRVRAAEKLGWKEVPCKVDIDLSQTKMKSRVAKDNKSYGEWDYDILSSDYDVDELFECGFTEIELGLGISIGEDEQEKKDKKKKTCPHCGEDI